MRAANGQFVKGSHWRRPALHWDAAWLRNEYEQQGRSAADIARDAGTTENAILYWLTKHSIPRRSMSQARAGNPALRFDHSNAVTLCRSCHAWVHSNNNKNKEFLQ